ncbi:MAG TPA: cysteine--tRNA ligase [Actinomycetota bacterium]|nr:cysteine--tRNA ligase [Actinomycetota bacterium]
MPLHVFDTLRREAVEFVPRDPGRVGLYCCGMTVYNYAHIGNMRTFVWFGFISSYLEYRGFDVTYVMNYTDIDDKIIERANIEKVPPDAITAKYIAAFEEDLRNLGARAPDIVPRATGHIDGMIKAIEGLIEKGFAYEAEGNVWFSVEKFSDYGKLSKRSLEDLKTQERIEPHSSKQHPVDFSLWKAAKEGEPAWESPWGPGRPGWHIECSVMSEKYLGMGFDLHGGGSDLIFPHHENEIAQAEALTGEEPFARYWLHAGMVQMDTEKMSKSLGNVVTAREILKQYPGEVVRYWMLQGSYRSQVVFTENAMADAAQSYDRWRIFLDASRHALGDAMPEPTPVKRTDDSDNEPPTGYVRRFIDAMDADFNSAEAFATVHELVKEGNKLLESFQRGEAEAGDLVELIHSFYEITAVLGFGFESTHDSELMGGLIGYLLELRETARAEKAFARADEIRDRLESLGVTIEDTPSGARWRFGAAAN